MKSDNLDEEEIREPFKSEFSDSEEQEDDPIIEDDDELPPPLELEDELMSNPLMSDLSSSLNLPPSNSNSQTQHKSKSIFDCKKNRKNF